MEGINIGFGPVVKGVSEFNLAAVWGVGLSINAGWEGPWTKPTRVYLDSVTVVDDKGDVVPWRFETDESAIEIGEGDYLMASYISYRSFF